MYCCNCGEKAKDGARFCHSCGAPLETGVADLDKTQDLKDLLPQALPEDIAVTQEMLPVGASSQVRHVVAEEECGKHARKKPVQGPAFDENQTLSQETREMNPVEAPEPEPVLVPEPEPEPELEPEPLEDPGATCAMALVAEALKSAEPKRVNASTDTSGLDVSGIVDLGPRYQPPAPEPQPAPSVQEVTAEPQAPASHEGRQEKNPKTLAIVLIVLAAIAVIAAVGAWFYVNAQNDARNHQEVTAAIQIDASHYSEGQGSGFLLHVSGTNLDGSSVEKDVVTNPGTANLSLQQGTYAITCAGDAIDSKGAFFARPDQGVTIVVDQSGYYVKGAGSLNANGQAILAYAQQDLTTVTDDQINGVEKWMRQQGVDATAVTAVINAATTSRDSAVAQAEEAAAKEREAQAAAEAAAKEAAEKQAAEQAKQKAISDNPASATTGSSVTLTGTVTRIYKTKAETGMAWDGVWYILSLPSSMNVGRQSVNEIQIAHDMNSTAVKDYKERYLSLEPWESAKDKLVTVKGTLQADPGTAHYIRSFYLDSPKLEKMYD